MSSEAISQGEIMRKNISAIQQMQRETAAARTMQDRIADIVTAFSGSMAFVYIHAIWFGLWVLLNVGLLHIPHISEFDPFPFSFLTLVVSLEAIFLSTFVLISQNRLSEVSDKRAELDLQVNLLAEQKATKVLEMLDEIAKQLDGMGKHFNFQSDPEVQALKVSPEPQEVLEVIEDTIKDDTEEVKQEVDEVKQDVDEVKQEVGEAVKDITDEMEVVRTDARRTSGQLQEVASDVHKLKQEVKAVTGEHEHLALK